MKITLFSFFCFILFLFPKICSATHLKAGEIQVRRIDCNSLTFEITLVVYVYTNTSVLVGGSTDFLSFGDGTKMLLPETTPTEILDARQHIGKTVFRTFYTYKTPGKYFISYNEGSRNEGVVNMDNSISTTFHVEAMIVVEEGTCNSFPVLLNPAIDRACNKSAFLHNPGAFDPDHDSLSYELAVPMKDATTPVGNYRFPNNPGFYNSYSQGNEGGNGVPTFEINPITGLLTWDAPGMLGQYSAAIKIREWKKSNDGTWYESSYFIRDMEIIVSDCANTAPSLLVQEKICVVAGQDVELNLRAMDIDNDSVRFDFFSELLQISAYQSTVSPAVNVGVFKPSPLEVKFHLPTSCELVRREPYQLTIKVSDRKQNSFPISRYYTVSISVIPPAPVIESVTVNPVSKQVTLQWSISTCNNIQTYQVWRRTSSVEYDQGECAKGMPATLRYELLATMPSSQQTYTDRQLEIGAQYCYRILPIVTGNNPGKLSNDICVIPKPAEAPVITNVSVDDTDQNFGKMIVRWTPPYEIDKTQYPPPYHYQVLRKNETMDGPFEPVGGLHTDTVMVDQALNTLEHSYRYFVQLYVKSLSDLPLDSSSQASSIRANSQSKVGQIDLQWSAKTPWSNSSENNPSHLIFRSNNKNGPFELIDSVNVFDKGFAYSDRGNFRNASLARDPYYYKIKTRGTYGNPLINDPLENFSPVFFGQVLDTIPPCAPLVSMEAIDCSRFSCDGRNYYTSLQWQSIDESCDADVVAYEVVVKNDSAQVYSSLGVFREKFFRHTALTNLDYCYRVISIDHVGNRSDSSAVICNTSCLKFQLPNVITPGLIDGNNDFLTVYDSENATQDDCVRSVKKVELSIYNRWGEEIFVKEFINEQSRIIWPAVNSLGNEVPAGAYFFNAKVDFQTNNPAKQHQEMKGWVHVLR